MFLKLDIYLFPFIGFNFDWLFLNHCHLLKSDIPRLSTRSGIILCMHPANERRRYNVTLSLIVWEHIYKMIPARWQLLPPSLALSHQYVKRTVYHFHCGHPQLPTGPVGSWGVTIVWYVACGFASVWITCGIQWTSFNSLDPGGFHYSLKIVNFKFMLTINILSIFCEIAIRWMPQHLTDH